MRTAILVALGVVALGAVAVGCGAPDAPGELSQATTCAVKLAAYPVRAKHNNGYDSTAGNSSLWTCNADHSNSDYNSNHLGNDIWAAEGAPVAATVDGTLKYVAFSSYSGNKLTIVDACGWYHFYCHLKGFAAGMSDGVKVKAGQIVGYVGNTGTASNGVIHLHYSIYPDNDYNRGIDPWPALHAVEQNVCGPLPPPVPPVPSAPPYLAAMRQRAASDNGTVCGRGPDGVVCRVYDGSGFATEVKGPGWSDAAGWGDDKYGSTIQLGDVDGDGRADVCGRASDGVHCQLSDGKGFPTALVGPKWSDASGWGEARYYSTIQLADIDGDGKADLCARASDKIYCYLSDGKGFPTEVQGPAWSNGAGWGDEKYYATIQFADVDGDGKADLCARASDRVHCYLSDGKGFPTHVDGPAWSDAAGWDRPEYGATIRFVDVNGDGKADVCGRANDRVHCYLSDGKAFPTHVDGPAWSDAAGWNQPKYYATLQFADVDGDGKADVCGRASDRVHCMLSDGKAFPTAVDGPGFSDAAGWGAPEYYLTVQLADVDGDGKADVCGRASDRVRCMLSNGKAFPTEVAGPDWSDAAAWNQPKHYASLRYVAAAPHAAPGGGGGGGNGGSGGAGGGGGGDDPGNGDGNGNGDPNGSTGAPKGHGGCSLATHALDDAAPLALLVTVAWLGYRQTRSRSRSRSRSARGGASSR